MRLLTPRPVLGAFAELVNATNAVRPLGRKGYSREVTMRAIAAAHAEEPD